MKEKKKTILLIGNSPMVLDYEYGEKIDNFPLVARFNDFVIDGFENYIGTKTNIWIRTSLETKHNPANFKSVYFAYPPILEHLFGSRNPNLRDTKNRKIFMNNVQVIPTKFYEEVNAKLNDRPNWASSGLLAIFYFIKMGYYVVIHGFDSFSGKKIHYYHDNATVRMHNPIREKQMINELLASKSIMNFCDYGK